jgi:DNA-binding transcriptional LysR family regulator
MNLSQDNLRLLLTVIDTGSFSAAARVLQRAPSAVSMAIANLEADLNIQLFDRQLREPIPTAAALALAAQARSLQQQIEQWQAHALSLSQGLESKLSIAIEPELLSINWAAPVAALAVQFPDLEVEIVNAPHEDAMELLHSNRVQLALLFERAVFDGRENFQEVWQESLIAVISPEHPLMASRQPIELQDLIQDRQIVVASRNQPNIKPRLLWSHRYWRTDNHEAALNLTLQKVGWTILPSSFVQPYIDQQRLCRLNTSNFNPSFPLCVDLVWSKQQVLGLAASALIQLIRSESLPLQRK